MKRCPQCRTLYGDQDRFCTLDGSHLAPEKFSPDTFVGSVVAERYEIQQVLNETPFGATYVARHAELDCLYTLEILLHDDVEMQDRFRRGAIGAARVTHPNVLHVHDLGRTADNLLFRVTETFAGTDLVEYRERGLINGLGDVASIITQIADGLQATHDAGVIHRDIKPENILVAVDTKRLAAKLTRFDVALLAPEEPTAQEGRITGEGLIVGTPEFMSPEQVRGNPLNAQSDIFQFGIVIFELLTGKIPYDGRNQQEMMINRLRGHALRLRDREPGIQFPEPLERAVARALAKDPQNRYDRARDLGADVASAMLQMAKTAHTKSGTFPAASATQVISTTPVPEVFICYAREDEDFALALARKLERQQVPVWIDKLRIVGGANWNRAIDEALERSTRMVVILSPAAVASEQVQSEWLTALEQRRHIVPVVCQECRVPRQLKLLQNVALTSNDLEGEGEMGPLLRALGVA